MGRAYSRIERLDETNPTSPRSLNSDIIKTSKCPSNDHAAAPASSSPSPAPDPPPTAEQADDPSSRVSSAHYKPRRTRMTQLSNSVPWCSYASAPPQRLLSRRRRRGREGRRASACCPQAWRLGWLSGTDRGSWSGGGGRRCGGVPCTRGNGSRPISESRLLQEEEIWVDFLRRMEEESGACDWRNGMGKERRDRRRRSGFVCPWASCQAKEKRERKRQQI
ncbi:hypothetical protein M5K25_015893 [Dendrobium thyrsiflorum]|uniref:Uncharacterized protein n=1 Tax=Dendrobium thyrsiflorum TaxID=117978 RepID=A0ABD0USD7_DENTH